MNDPQGALDDLIKRSNASYAAVSRLLGRNSAYVQQYIKRGSPAQLDAADVALLAAHFDVPQALLGGDATPQTVETTAINVPVLWSAHNDIASPNTRLFDQNWLQGIVMPHSTAAIVGVGGDAMAPTLFDGDEVLIQRRFGNEVLREGLYAIRVDFDILVRRIAIEPTRRRISVLTDNPCYPDWNGIGRQAIHILGMVKWIGHRVG